MSQKVKLAVSVRVRLYNGKESLKQAGEHHAGEYQGGDFCFSTCGGESVGKHNSQKAKTQGRKLLFLKK